jgi:hypothetical protein
MDNGVNMAKKKLTSAWGEKKNAVAIKKLRKLVDCPVNYRGITIELLAGKRSRAARAIRDDLLGHSVAIHGKRVFLGKRSRGKSA